MERLSTTPKKIAGGLSDSIFLIRERRWLWPAPFRFSAPALDAPETAFWGIPRSERHWKSTTYKFGF
jgi:hypothetical protein